MQSFYASNILPSPLVRLPHDVVNVQAGSPLPSVSLYISYLGREARTVPLDLTQGADGG